MNRAQRRQLKKRREICAGESEDLKHASAGLANAIALPNRVLVPADAESLQAAYIGFEDYFLVRTDNETRDVLADFSEKQNVLISGIVSNAKCGGYVDDKSGKVFENVVSRICLSEPYVYADGLDHWKPIGSHVWLFTDKLVTPKFNLSRDVIEDVHVKFGELLNVVCSIKPYRSKGVLRYGPEQWTPLKSELAYSYRNKIYSVPKKLIKSPDVLSLVYDRDNGSSYSDIALRQSIIPELMRLRSLADNVRNDVIITGMV